MAKTTNGTTQELFTINCTEYPDRGYVVFEANEGRPPDPAALADLLSKSVTGWMKQHADVKVATTLPIVRDGQTVAVHWWFDFR